MSVYKRGKKGVYYMDFVLHGQRVYKSTKMYTKKEAEMVEMTEKVNLEKSLKSAPEERETTMTLSSAFQKCYDERWKYNEDGENTLSRTKKIVHYLGDKCISEVNDDDITALINGLEQEGLELATVNRHLSFLNTTISMARNKWKVIKERPYIELKAENNGRIKVYSDEEEDAIVKFFTNNNKPDLVDLTQVLADTGFRLGELLRVEYADINFESELITIWKNKEGDKPKSVPMTSRVKQILIRRKEHNPVKPFPMAEYMVENAWKRMRQKLGFEKDDGVVIHALRHTCASRLVSNGVDLYMVKEWLGHSTIKMTERYLHLKPERLKGAAEKLERRK